MSSGSPQRHNVMETRNLADLYNLPPLDWAAIDARLAESITEADARLAESITEAPGGGRPNTCWLATINRDGSPHVTGVGALWVDGAAWFVTGEGSRKGRNLARDSRCTLSVAVNAADVVVEGEAHKVTDPDKVAAMAKRWAAGGWPC